MGPRSCLDIFEEGKILLSLLGFEHQWSSTKPSHYTDHAIIARTNFGWKEKNESYYTSTVSHCRCEIFFSDEFNKCCNKTQLEDSSHEKANEILSGDQLYEY